MKNNLLYFFILFFLCSELSAQLPSITTFFPISGKVNTGVYITGNNFINVDDVQFNGISSPQFYVASPSQIYATVPDAARTDRVSVLTLAGNTTSTRNFTILKDTSIWLSKSSLSTVRSQHCAIATNKKIYVFGGWNGTTLNATTEIYDPTTNIWSVGAGIPTPARGMCFALGSDSMIYAIGGKNSTSTTTNVYRYNPITNNWISRNGIAVGVWEAAATTANGKIYVFGGDGALGSTRIYDISKNSWTFGTKIPKPVMQHAAICGNDGKIYIIGGRSTQTSKPWGAVQIYDPITELWTVGTNMKIPKVQFGAAKAANGKIYVIGGKAQFLNNTGPFFNTVEIYDPQTNIWTNGSSILTTLGELKAVNLNDNIYAVGGTNGTYQKTNIELIISPLAPSNLVATPISAKSIKLTWTDNSLNEERFRIERATSAAGPFTVITNKTTNSTYAVDNNVLPDSTYYYQLKAYNAAGFSGNSNISQASTSKSKLVMQKEESKEKLTELENKLVIYPNPSTEYAGIYFSVAESQYVQINIYDFKGLLIEKIYNAYAEKGRHYHTKWKSNLSPPGNYFVQMIMKNKIISKEIVKG